MTELPELRSPPPPRSTAWGEAEQALAQVPRLVRRTWRRLLLTGLVGGVLGVAVSFLVPQKFVTETVFFPQTSGGSRLPASITGLAAQFGVSAAMGGGFTPNLFSLLPGTRYIREQVALARYSLPSCLGADSTAGNLITGYGFEKKPERKAMDAAIRRLDNNTDVKFDPVTSTVGIAVTACSPELAAAIAGQYLVAINRFNEEVLRSQAREEREFAESRIKELATELSSAEDDLARFYAANRTFQSSPALQERETQLRRQVSLLEATYTEARTQYERARMDEARDQPALTIVDPPEPPAKKSWPKRWLFGLVAALLAAAIALGRDVLRLQSPA